MTDTDKGAATYTAERLRAARDEFERLYHRTRDERDEAFADLETARARVAELEAERPTHRGHKILTEAERAEVDFPYPPEPEWSACPRCEQLTKERDAARAEATRFEAPGWHEDPFLVFEKSGDFLGYAATEEEAKEIAGSTILDTSRCRRSQIGTLVQEACEAYRMREKRIDRAAENARLRTRVRNLRRAVKGQEIALARAKAKCAPPLSLKRSLADAEERASSRQEVLSAIRVALRLPGPCLFDDIVVHAREVISALDAAERSCDEWKQRAEAAEAEINSLGLRAKHIADIGVDHMSAWAEAKEHLAAAEAKLDRLRAAVREAEPSVGPLSSNETLRMSIATYRWERILAAAAADDAPTEKE